MTTEERKALKAKIKATITKLELDIEQFEVAVKPISPENSIGRVSRMDAINNKGVAEAAMRSAKKKLNKLYAALEKIEDEDFGSCSRCGGPIPSPRLMYMPESTRCVRCADLH